MESYFFIPGSKLNKLHELCDLSGLFIQCDGGVNFETIPSLKKSGVNNFICGSSSLYKGCNLASSLDENKKVITQNKILLERLLNG